MGIVTSESYCKSRACLMKKRIVIACCIVFHFYLELIMRIVRRKEKIRFGFILQDLPQWKTEMLYKHMQTHPRFEPVICITPHVYGTGSEKLLEEYCKAKGYGYVLLSPEKKLKRQIDIDMATHQKPYQREIHPAHRIDRNKSIPVVVIPYYLSTITEPWVVNQKANLLCWRQFVDNENCKRAWEKIHWLNGRNYAVTGTPFMDELFLPKESFADVWKCKDSRKRIIYAPHHTIADWHWEGIGYSTFLDYCQFMLTMRDKYKEQAYFVFKPHPLLYGKLVERWGKEKTDEYYSAWDQPGISIVETGDYVSLFKHSDALIHDCGSFTVEYLYTDNPVMYLDRGEDHADNMIPYAKEAYELHYHAKTEEDIEGFVLNVINGEDVLKEKRIEFRERCLLPPNGRTACENIVNAILGVKQ